MLIDLLLITIATIIWYCMGFIITINACYDEVQNSPKYDNTMLGVIAVFCGILGPLMLLINTNKKEHNGN